jgi:hypothetical protein
MRLNNEAEQSSDEADGGLTSSGPVIKSSEQLVQLMWCNTI